jgi:outer membrane immunogenic protein
MKRIAIALLTSAAVVGLSQAASAADLAVKAAPPPAPAPTWTGLYIGVHGGGAWQSTPTWSFTDPSGVLLSQSVKPTSNLGGVGGLQAGYNYQFAPAWVVGVEGDISWTNLQSQITNQPLLFATGASVCPTPVGNACSRTMSQNDRWLASVRGKLGFTGWWNTMFYGTGGVAWANSEYTGTTIAGPATAGLGAATSNTSVTTTQTGWVAGGGAEWQATTNILFRVEYLYYRINGGQTNSATFVPGIAPVAAATAPLGYTWANYNVQVARVALSYKF